MILAVMQMSMPFFARITGIGMPIEARQPVDPTQVPEGPAAYAFGIWFVMYVLALAYAVHQVLPRQRALPLYRRIGWLTAGIFLTGSLWMLLAQTTGDGWHLVLLIFAMWGLALAAFFRTLADPGPGRFAARVVTPMLGLYAGWLTVAVFLNLTTVLRSQDFGTFGLSITGYAMLTLLPAGLVALALIRVSSGYPWFAFAVAWGLVGIVVANLGAAANMIVASVAMVLLAAVALTLWWARRAANGTRSAVW